MINNILLLYAWSSRNKRNSKGLSKLLARLVRLIIMHLSKILLPILLRLSPNKPSLTCREEDVNNPRIIVSFTSFPRRIHIIWMVVELMFRQTMKPDMVVLYLSKLEIDSMDALPKRLRMLMERGLQIRFKDGNYRSHKKYTYAMEEFPNDIIITVDDDLFYTNMIISKLMEDHIKHPRAVIANRTHTLSYDDNNQLLPYRKWRDSLDESGYNYLQTGVMGVLYPPYNKGTLYKDILDRELAMELTPMGDDLWLYAMVRLGGSKVIQTSYRIDVLGIRIFNNLKLSKTNCNQNFNDTQIEKLRNYYIASIGIDPFVHKKADACE
ncbi:MAG: hypothetical protein SNH66_07645 [Rikenellaceae bacterium]